MVCKLYKSLRVWVACLVCLIMAGVSFALDASRYVPARHDAIRNGVMLSYGQQDNRWCLVLPGPNKAVTNVYDFGLFPVEQNRPVRLPGQRRSSYRFVYTCGQDRGKTAQPEDTLVFAYVIKDTSRLDSSYFTKGRGADISSIVNRINVRADYIPAYSGNPGTVPRITVLRDMNRNYRYDAGDISLKRQEAVALAPGEQLVALAVVPIPASYRFAYADTVRLVCSSERKSPSGQHLTRVVNRILSVQDRGLLQAMVEGEAVGKNGGRMIKY